MVSRDHEQVFCLFVFLIFKIRSNQSSYLQASLTPEVKLGTGLPHVKQELKSLGQHQGGLQSFGGVMVWSSAGGPCPSGDNGKEQRCRIASFRGQWRGAVQLMGAGSTKLQPGRAPGVKPLHEIWFSMYLHVRALFQVMRAQLRYAHGLECFPKGSPVEKTWNSSGQILF